LGKQYIYHTKRREAVVAIKIRGLVKNPGTTGNAAYVGRTGGYHDTWDTGRASYRKRIQKITGINKPAE
jgi:hypothetical protein